MKVLANYLVLSMFDIFVMALLTITFDQWRIEEGGWGVQTPPAPKFRSFDKSELK
jgi:hypothetical protein